MSDPLPLVVGMALRAVRRQEQTGAYHYCQTCGWSSSLWAPAPVYADCAWFSRLCLKAARVPDPMGNDYTAYANSSALIVRGEHTGRPVPGCLVFYGPGGSNHVNVYIGNGAVVNMGSKGEPVVEGIDAPIPWTGGIAGYRLYRGVETGEIFSGNPSTPSRGYRSESAYDPAKWIRTAWGSWGKHGRRAYQHAEYIRTYMDLADHVDFDGPKLK